MRKSGQKHR